MIRALSRLVRSNLPIQITIANSVGFGLTFLTIPIVTRGIGSVGRGETAAALAAFAVVPTIVGLGIPLELRRRFASGRDEASTRAGRDLFCMAFPVSAVVGLLFVWTIYSEVSRDLQLIALLGIAATPLAASWAADAGAMVGSGRYRAVAALRLVQPLVTLLVVGGFAAFTELSAPVVLGAAVASMAVTAAFGFSLNRASIRGARADRRSLASAGAKYAGSAVAESASSRLDQAIVLPLIGASAAGQYTVAAAIGLLPLAVGQAMAADYFRAAAVARTSEALDGVCRTAIREGLSLIAPVCLIFVTVAAPLCPLVFGSEFSQAARLLWLLLPGSVAVALGYIASMLLAAQGKGRVMTQIQIGGVVLGISVLLLLGPRWGAAGAAAASSAGFIGVLCAQLIALKVPATALVPSWQDAVRGFRRLF